MKTLLRGGSVWQSGSFWNDCPIIWENEKIIAVGDACQGIAVDRVIEANGMRVLPGLVDVHTHGRAGYDFGTATEEQMREIKLDYARHGVTSVFATLASGTAEEWHRAIALIQACGYDGIHLEGNFLNPAKKGAHAPSLIVSPDASVLERFLEEIHIPCHISAAYELDTDGSFTACALQHGATLGLAHTAATAEQTRLALARGVTSFTHLYNAMPPLHHREGGPVAVAFLGGGYGELIADGMHVCPEMITLAYKCLGADKTVLITDSMEGTGCPDGEYHIAGMPVNLKNGRAVTPDGALAGSTLNLWDGVKNLMKFASVPLEDAIACATVNPARMVGIDASIGSIAVGRRADLLLVDDSLEIDTVVLCGEELKKQ